MLGLACRPRVSGAIPDRHAPTSVLFDGLVQGFNWRAVVSVWGRPVAHSGLHGGYLSHKLRLPYLCSCGV